MPIRKDAGASGGTDNTDTSLNGEYRAGAGIYVNAEGQWTSPNGTVLKGQALAKAEANASAKYGVGYRNDNLYLEAVAEAKLRCEASIKAEMQRGNHTAGAELYAYAEVYAWAGASANVGKSGCWFEGGAIAGAKAGAGARTYYTNDGLIPFAVNNDTSVSAGAQVGAKIGGGYQVPEWNKDSKPITIGGEVNIALIAGLKTGGTITVDVDPVYDMVAEPVSGMVKDTVEQVAPIVEPVKKIIEPAKEVIAPVKNVVDKIIPSVPKHMPKPSNPFAKKKKKK